MEEKAFGERVRQLRLMVPEFAGNIRLLEHVADVHRGQIAEIEKAHRKSPTIHTARKIADAFGVSLDWLLKGVGATPLEADVVRVASEQLAKYRASRTVANPAAAVSSAETAA